MKIVKNMVKKIINKLINLLPIKNHIIFESHPDLSGNTFPLFKYMLENNLNEKYKLIWLVNDKNKYNNSFGTNVYFENIAPKKLTGRIKVFYLKATARCIISENRFIPKINKKQFSMYLTHGTVIKDIGAIYANSIGPKCDYLLYQSQFVKELTANLYQASLDKLVCLGFPRNDNLFVKSTCVKDIFKEKNFNKVIVWMPTFRQHYNKIRIDSTITFPLGIPILKSVEQLRELNTFLEERNTLLVLKPHPAQDLSVVKAESLSNFVLLYDEDLSKHNIQLYEFIGNADSLLTDYSSIYFDYLLLDRPIGITIDDIEEYGNTLGFIYENIFDILKGEYISNYDELLHYVDNVAKDHDIHREERNKIKDLMNHHQDNCSTKRVYEFIMEKAKL